MQIFRDTGLEPLEKVIRSSLKYYSETFNIDAIKRNLQDSLNIRLPELTSLKTPLEDLSKSLNNAVSQFIPKQKETVDYRAVVSSFLPPGARLVKPQYPENSNEIQFADLDGDGKRELVTSYATSEGINTLVLKKDPVQWYKIAEIAAPDFDSIHYRSDAHVSGDGKPYLLMGMESKLKNKTLLAYSLEGGSARKIFSKDYCKIDLQKSRGNTPAASKSLLSLWNEEAPGIYDIETVRWNGLELERMNNSRYLADKVVPYYIRKLKRDPNDAISWYNLATNMSKAGNRAHAMKAAELGLARSQDSTLVERFNNLRNRLS